MRLERRLHQNLSPASTHSLWPPTSLLCFTTFPCSSRFLDFLGKSTRDHVLFSLIELNSSIMAACHSSLTKASSMVAGSSPIAARSCSVSCGSPPLYCGALPSKSAIDLNLSSAPSASSSISGVSTGCVTCLITPGASGGAGVHNSDSRVGIAMLPAGAPIGEFALGVARGESGHYMSSSHTRVFPAAM
jgi:hypothetical protein